MMSGVINSVLRKSILSAVGNPLVTGVVERHGMRLGAARFVAGETLDEAVAVHRALNDRGLLTNTTLLGEGVADEAEVETVAQAYVEILDRIASEGLKTNVALKLTHLGLDISEELAFRNVALLTEHAERHGNFIRIDMEESSRDTPYLPKAPG
jgi:proline dehydrogenase